MRALYLCVLFLPAVVAQTPDFYLHDGDTVVFYGDSITNQRLYTAFTEAFVLTRFPELHIRFVHSGFSGDRVSGGAGGSIDERLDHDVFPYRPTVVTVMLGMNDGEYQPYDAGIFRKYAAGYRHIIEKLKTGLPTARITLLEPSAYDDVTRPPAFAEGYNSVLKRYGEFVRGLAKSEQLNVADLNAPVVALLRAANSSAPEQAQQLIPDRVHPGAAVHMIMAEALLKAWHAPSTVTSVEIDAAAGAVEQARNTTVDAVDVSNGIAWTQLDKSLPMPTDLPDETMDLALRCSDFFDALNQERLKIAGLAEGKYRLLIDDQEIKQFDAADLARGINLATMATPMSKQAQLVLDLTHRHNHLHFARWRMVEDALKDYTLTKKQTVLDGLDALEAEVVALQQSAAIPKPHHYRLERLAPAQ